MKKVFSSVLFVLATFSISAQTIKLKAGTSVPVKSNQTVYARNVEIGDQIKFSVTSDIKVDGKIVIPTGTIAYGRVTEAKKSSLAGTKGKLNINLDYVILENGEKVYLTSGEIRISGKNRTPLAVITALFAWPCIFIPGTKAVMPIGDETIANVSNTIEITL